nr:hypothetical protein [Tanacetum cinerariifolium]
MPLGDHAAHWANYLGELVRELPLHYPFWLQMLSEQKAEVVAKIRTPSTTTRQKKSFTLKTRRLPKSVDGMCRRRGLIQSHIKTKFITREFFMEKIKEVIQHCDTIVPELIVTTKNKILKKEMPRLVKLAVNKDREVSYVDIPCMVSKEFAAHGPKLIKELFQKHMHNTTLNLYPKTNSSTATTSSADLQKQLYLREETWRKDILEKEESFVNEKPILPMMKHL